MAGRRGLPLTTTGGVNGLLIDINGGALTVDGPTIQGHAGNDASLISVTSGSLELKSGSITGNTTSGLGGGVLVQSGGTFVMSGGSVTGNTANLGQDVYAGGTFTRNGGTLGSYFPTGTGTAADPWFFGNASELGTLNMAATPGYYKLPGRFTINSGDDVFITTPGARHLDGGGCTITQQRLRQHPERGG